MGTIALDEPSTVDKRLDTLTTNNGSDDVEREVVVIGGANFADVAPVDATNGLAVDVKQSALPTGAATAAKQPALGTAGTASSDVLSVQGIASMVALKVDGSAVTQPVSAASLPLPTGAATSAKQDSIITALALLAPESGGNLDAIAASAAALETALADPATETTLAALNAKVTAVNTGAVTISGALPAGTNAIGKLAANSGVDIGDVDVTSLPAIPAGTNLIGRVSASPESSTVYNGTTALTPKFAAIAASTSGNNTLVAAVTSKKIRVLAYNFIANGTVNAKFQSAAGGTDLTGLKYCVANMGLVAPFNPAGWFETVAGELLNLNLSAAVAVGGELVYVEV